MTTKFHNLTNIIKFQIPRQTNQILNQYYNQY